jgi:hypothetical protein
MHILKFFLPIVIFGVIAVFLFANIEKKPQLTASGADVAGIEAASGQELETHSVDASQ